MIARVPAGAVVIAGADLEVLRYAVEVTQRHRRLNGRPPSAGLSRLGELVGLLAECGQTDRSEAPVEDAEGMTTSEAAGLLGCSERTARRRARQLGGRKVGGVWMIDRLAVLEHNDGKALA